MMRSLLFNVAFWAWTLIMLLVAAGLLLRPRLSMIRHAERWERGIQWLLRTIVGLDYQVRGRERLPDGPAIYALKHQSAWDTVSTHLLIRDPAIALKQELTRIPVFGRCLMHAGMIRIDRGHGTRALRSLIDGGRQAAACGRAIVIFPEGTRTPVGGRNPYHPGVAALYRHLELPVVPVALNSGLFWGRRRFTKRAGRITVAFLAPIMPGMERKAFMAELERRIESATEALVKEARLEDPTL